MNRSIQMKYWNKLKQTNSKLSETKAGRKMIMKEAIFMVKVYPAMAAVEAAFCVIKNAFIPSFTIGGISTDNCHPILLSSPITKLSEPKS